jgi:N-acetylglutamate synthase-like GNAT family acetyltransferase
MARRLTLTLAGEAYEEKDFYLEDLRGKSVLIAIEPESAAARPDLSLLAATVGDLVRNGTRVVLWWPALGHAVERRLEAALARAGVPRRRRGARRARLGIIRLADDGDAGADGVRGDLWEGLRSEGLSLIVGGPGGQPPFPEGPVALAVALRIPKLVLLDRHGGLLGPEPTRLSFVDESVLETLLRRGEAEWSGLGERRGLLVAVHAALEGGVEAVNLCTTEEIAVELFTYEGAGTLFTAGDYCHVDRLALDDYAQAERLLERGTREGFLRARSPEEIADVLAAGFGATICGRHLGGVAALLTAPYEADRAGEIVGLYSINRFKGEGVGERLVSRVLAEAVKRGLSYVFACAVDDRAKLFFARQGFERVSGRSLPAAKWAGYDERRRARVACFRRDLRPARAERP